MNIWRTFSQGLPGMPWLLLAIPLTACSGKIVSWQEEVKLNDGRVITITQKRKCEEVYDGHNVNPCLAREAWMSFKLPEFSASLIEWHYNLSPLVLNVHEGRLYVVGRPPTTREWKEWKYPQPRYVALRYESGAWHRISFADIPVAIYDTNLLIAMPDPEGTKVLGIDEKSKLNGYSSYLKFLHRVDPNHKQ